jgi:hypothetical protein
MRIICLDRISRFEIWSQNLARHAGVLSYVGVGSRKVLLETYTVALTKTDTDVEVEVCRPSS